MIKKKNQEVVHRFKFVLSCFSFNPQKGQKYTYSLKLQIKKNMW